MGQGEQSRLRQIECTIRRAREGDEQSLGELLEMQQRYLKFLAKLQIGRHLQGKVDASDIVQETFLDAHRAIARFQGETESQFIQWLKSIMATKLANTFRHYFGTKQRDIHLEQQWQAELDHSAVSLAGMFIDPHSSPSQHVQRVEQAKLVVEALARLPDHYQQVLVLRHLQGCTFPDVAQAMGKSVDSVEKIWLRGISRLRQECRNLGSRNEVRKAT
jgi:RNA polymerase sigma-70 factor (ECF subfamily)